MQRSEMILQYMTLKMYGKRAWERQWKDNIKKWIKDCSRLLLVSEKCENILQKYLIQKIVRIIFDSEDNTISMWFRRCCAVWRGCHVVRDDVCAVWSGNRVMWSDDNVVGSDDSAM